MVTGIETAGLVLGAFPLVIEAVKYYISCASKVKEISRHEDNLRQFMRELEVEMTIFQDTWCQLTGCDPKNLDNAIRLPQDYVSIIPTHLHSASIQSIGIVCESMRNILNELKEKFQKYEQADAGYLKMLHVAFSLTPEWRDRQFADIRRYNCQFRELITRAQPTNNIIGKQSKPKNVAESYQKVRAYAIVLYNVLQEKLGVGTCGCQGPHCARLQLDLRVSGVKKVVEQHGDPGSILKFNFAFPVPFVGGTQDESKWRAFELENVEKNSETQKETNPPVAATATPESTIGITVAQSIDIAETTIKSSPNKEKLQRSMHLVERWRLRTHSVVERMKQPVRKTGDPGPSRSKAPGTLPDPPNNSLPLNSLGVRSNNAGFANSQDPHSKACGPKAREFDNIIIQCLCTTIRTSAETHACLGVLVSEENRKHRLWVPKQPLCISGTEKTASLADMFILPAPFMKERLKLGVKLASSVMQLHKTAWLGESWSKRDIKFFVQNTTCPTRPVIDYPFLHQDFVTINPPQVNNQATLIGQINQSLYSLGIILIELWHWKDLEFLRGQFPTQTGDESVAAHGAKFLIDLRLAKQLHENAGVKYGEAVRRCIQGVDTWNTELEKPEFKNKVYSEIIKVLEEHLETFTGQGIEDIFDKGE